MRDSFTSGMLPYITDNFKETSCEHYNLCTPELLKEEDADIVVYEVVERYIDRMFMIDLVCAE